MPIELKHQNRLLCGGAALIVALSLVSSLGAQQVTANQNAAPMLDAALPDAPIAQTSQASQSGQAADPSSSTTGTTSQTDNPDAVSPNGTQQTKRILGVMPNFRSVSADIQLPRQTAKDKLVDAAHDSFDYSSFLLAAVQAGFSMEGKSYPEFHQGVVGYGRYYWHTLLDTGTENFMVGGAGPILFHQDSRFYTLGHGSFGHRVWYGATRVFVTKTDDGGSAFNYSEIVGSGASAGLSTLYYPTKYRTWTKVGQKWLTSDIIDSANFTFKEFWPDIHKAVFHNRF
ncbi:hypothetical protein GCM10011507_26860 [Edaphobacter acidisoli]|uniref:Uncharacterized protein n=1 Tax=Edaphobacter acidisoli TaxID=2040573 RepID=A0A916W7G7_9BACT|nr:hypothetical protein [Edaphobacter acidisoli]GGA74122.1 hypothetical protein GCM10011507_26860 [Edaphobacter acidisoli]